MTLVIGFTAPKQSGKSTAARFIKRSYLGVKIMSLADPLKRSVSSLTGRSVSDLSSADTKAASFTFDYEPFNARYKRSSLFRYSLFTAFKRMVGTKANNEEGLLTHEEAKQLRAPSLRKAAAPYQCPMAVTCGYSSDKEFFIDFATAFQEVFPAGSTMTFREIMQKFGTELMRDRFHPDFWIELLVQNVAELDGDKRIVLVDDVRFLNEANAIRERFGGLVVGIKNPSNWDVGDSHASEEEMRTRWADMCDFEVLNDSSITHLKRNVNMLLRAHLTNA